MLIPSPSREGDREAVEGVGPAHRRSWRAPSATAQKGAAPPPLTGEE